jgi:hypothetical protein
MIFYYFSKLFIIPIISIIGFITNLVSAIVFSLIIKNEQRRDDMYRHLLLKSICEMLGCFFSVFGVIYYNTGTLKNTYIMAIWNVYFENYIIKALFMASTGFEIAATFSCAISIEKRMKWCQKKLSFWLWIIFILITSFGLEMFPAFTFTIRDFKITDRFNRTIHKYTPYTNYLAFKRGIFGLVESYIKEIIFLLILLSLNSYILFKLIQIGRRKKRLTANNSRVQSSNRAENRKIIMILVLFLYFVLGHMPNIVYFGVNTSFYANQFWIHFKSCAEIFLYLSYSTSLFVYFGFNNIFRRLFLKLIHFRCFN